VSIQYDQAPQLTLEQQDALQREYDARAKSSTTAFLLCYFLGLFGAQRMYLGQWGAAGLRLLLPLIALSLAILGALDVLPFATFSLAIITLVCGLIWEALDLARIDREVSAANAALMNRLLATIEPLDATALAASAAPAPQLEPENAPTWPPAATEAATAPPAASAPTGSESTDAPPLQSEPLYSAPEPPEATLTLEPVPPLAPVWSARDENTSVGASSAPPTASAYVPPVAPEIISGGSAAASAATAEPENPPIWPGAPADAPRAANAPEWPGAVESQTAAPVAEPAPQASTVERPPVGSPPQPEQPAQPEARRLKLIRVRRKITLDDGTVVGEQVLEDYFPVEMDTQEAAKTLEARFQPLSPDEIAKRADLPPGTDLQLKRE
jgi:TM2 domain-containing membrane protein YozV